MSMVESIRNVLSGATERAQSRPTDPAEPTEPGGATGVAEPTEPSESAEATESAAPRKTQLYRCDPCNVTYVSEGMDSCSQCEASVEQVPTEQDLGLL